MSDTNAKQAFINLLLESNALRFGSFKTKGGRMSPYFIDFGCISAAKHTYQLAKLYADALQETYPGAHNLYGPAYKGIPLVVSMAAVMGETSQDVSWTFNRKETKDHGEGGILVGHKYRGGEQVIIVEDVLSRGTSLRDTLNILRLHNVEIAGMLIGVDRQETGYAGRAARDEIEENLGIKIRSLLTIHEIVTALHNQTVLGKVWIDDTMRGEIAAFLSAHGKPLP